jgi:hypothetical protein
MSCPKCTLGNQVEVSAEMIIHCDGLKNLENSGVLLFPKLLVCVNCGFSQLTVPKTSLALLASDSPNSELPPIAAAG